MTVRVVTDSTSDLSPDVLEELSIVCVPLSVLFGDKAYRDGVDLTTDQFFQKLVESRVAPSTSQPSVGEFRQVYERLAGEADGIVSVHIGAELSGTVAAATLARDSLSSRCPIEIIDTETASLGIGFTAIAAARAARAGAPLADVAEAARSVVRRQHTICFLDTLEYARRGGRISRVESILGGLLHLKPIFIIQGVSLPLSRARTRPAGLKRLFETAMAYPNIVDVGIMHATTPEDAELIAGWTRERLPGVPIRLARLGPTLGTHGGPGVMAMTVVEGEKSGT
ncbi:MAG: DegV family protein [Dehalococcoidia bacterium]|jgi:DegV family protein with EDD domain